MPSDNPFDPEQTVDTGKQPVLAPEPPAFDPELEAALVSLEVDVVGGRRPRVASGTTPPPQPVVRPDDDRD